MNHRSDFRRPKLTNGVPLLRSRTMNKTTSIGAHACSPYDLFNVGWVSRAVCGVTHQPVGHGPTPCRMAWEGAPLRGPSRRVAA